MKRAVGCIRRSHQDAGPARLDAKRAAHGHCMERDLDVPDAIDWQRWAVEDIDRALRSLWNHVELGHDVLPVRAEWRIETRWLCDEWCRDPISGAVQPRGQPLWTDPLETLTLLEISAVRSGWPW